VVSRVRRRAIPERPPALRGGREGGSEGWGRTLVRSAADRALGLARRQDDGRAGETELGCLSVRLGSDLHGSTGRDLLRAGERLEAVFPAGLSGPIRVVAEPGRYDGKVAGRSDACFDQPQTSRTSEHADRTLWSDRWNRPKGSGAGPRVRSRRGERGQAQLSARDRVGLTGLRPSATGSPEAVTRLRLPRNVARGEFR
jgi:hypothetical protein